MTCIQICLCQYHYTVTMVPHCNCRQSHFLYKNSSFFFTIVEFLVMYLYKLSLSLVFLQNSHPGKKPTWKNNRSTQHNQVVKQQGVTNIECEKNLETNCLYIILILWTPLYVILALWWVQRVVKPVVYMFKPLSMEF